MSTSSFQRIAVIGLGRFGMSLARRLASHGAEVIAIDSDERLIEEISVDDLATQLGPSCIAMPLVSGFGCGKFNGA